MSLKSKTGKKALLKKLSEGQIVRGTVKRIKDFGLFIQLQDSTLIGLAHKSELSDKFIKDIGELYKEGQGKLLASLADILVLCSMQTELTSILEMQFSKPNSRSLFVFILYGRNHMWT